MKRPESGSLPSLTTALLLLTLVAGSLVLVTGREVSHQLAMATCTDAADCGGFPESPPVCEEYGRDRVVARESFAFAQQEPAEGTRMIQFGDDSAEVVVDSDSGPADVYDFRRWEEAQQWIVDHSADLGEVADHAAGPSAQPVRDGYYRAIQLLGFDHLAQHEPEATTIPIDQPTGDYSHGVLQRDSEGNVVEVSVVIPLDEATPELQEIGAALGMWGFLSYSVELDEDLEATQLTFGGPAADEWSLAELEATEAGDEQLPEEDPPDWVEQNQAVQRNFVLDLDQRANDALYREVFSRENVAGVAAPLLTAEEWPSEQERQELYEQIEDRIRDDAVVVETSHVLQGSPDPETAIEALEGLTLVADPSSSPDTRLADARSADLAVASSSFSPLLTCDEHDAEGDHE